MILPFPILQANAPFRYSAKNQRRKYKTVSEQISTTRAGFKLHRENFAEFREGVLGRMKTTTTTADEEEDRLKRIQSRTETMAAVRI